ncbi:flowering-promoting factor 1-like protein 1 [Bidens hawaiensis]|uniref:flowering-promoting factor 1-like protein 1 n=1 Tax=Bidens hawaiensis TaxID=980011 RepID=UPI00404941C5
MARNTYINLNLQLHTFIFLFLKPKLKLLSKLVQNKLIKDMSGVWVFKQNGVVQLVESPTGDFVQGSARRKVLVHVPTNKVVTSYHVLERLLASLGWERYYDDPSLFQFHRRSNVHLISLPKDFNKFKSMHMFDIVIKNRNMFEVRDT